jgi:CelD/BcsL family acetyltransferase involved in cellulose biosynthesis
MRGLFLAVYTLNPLIDSRWNDFVESHPRGSIFHTPGWLQALQRTYGYEPVVYTTSAPGERLRNGIPFCRIRSWLTGHRIVSLPFTDHCEPLVDVLEEGKEMLDSLHLTVSSEELKYVELRPRHASPLTEASMQRNTSFCFHELDLGAALEEIFRGFQKDSIQRKIRRAERETLHYEEGRSEMLLKQFYALFVLTRRRHRAPPQPIDWFRNLVTCLGDRLKIRVASSAGRPIASMITLRHAVTMVYKYGASDATAHNLGAMPFLFWKAIQDASGGGGRKFDFGRTDCSNAGLITFKDRWGSQRSELTYWRLPSQSARTRGEWKQKLKFAEPIFACIPDRLLAASGRILYRHIG